MPKFTKLDPREVQIGRGRGAFESRQAFVQALKASDAGRIDLESGDRPVSIKRVLQEAAKEAGVRLRSSWADSSQQALLWKKTAGSPVARAASATPAAPARRRRRTG